MDGLNNKCRWNFDREGMFIKTGIEIGRYSFASSYVNVN
jgi:hypothetical protein